MVTKLLPAAITAGPAVTWGTQAQPGRMGAGIEACCTAATSCSAAMHHWKNTRQLKSHDASRLLLHGSGPSL